MRSYRVAKRSFVWRVTRGSAMAVHQPHPSPLQLGASSCNVLLVKRLLDGCRYTSSKSVVELLAFLRTTHHRDTFTLSNGATTMCCHSFIVLSTMVPGEPATPSFRSRPPSRDAYYACAPRCPWRGRLFARSGIAQSCNKFISLRASAILLLTLSKCNTA